MHIDKCTMYIIKFAIYINIYCSLFYLHVANITIYIVRFSIHSMLSSNSIQPTISHIRRIETEGHPHHLSTDRERSKLLLHVYTGCKRN